MLESFAEIAQAHPLLAPVLFMLLRMVPILIPPIPGIAFDLLGIALFGWLWGLIYALIGAHVASVIAFYIARYHREWVAAHIAPIAALHRLEEQYSERQKFVILVAVRFLTSPFFDYMNYLAGLTKLSLPRYLLSTFVGVFPYAFCIYYFGERLLSAHWLYGIFAFLGTALLFGVFQERLVRRIATRFR